MRNDECEIGEQPVPEHITGKDLYLAVERIRRANTLTIASSGTSDIQWLLWAHDFLVTKIDVLDCRLNRILDAWRATEQSTSVEGLEAAENALERLLAELAEER